MPTSCFAGTTLHPGVFLGYNINNLRLGFLKSKMIIMKSWSPTNFFFANVLGNIMGPSLHMGPVLLDHLLHLPASTIALLIAMHDTSPSFLSPTPTLPGSPLLWARGKGHELTWLPPGCCAEATGVVPKRATEVPGVWRWGYFSLRTTTFPDGEWSQPCLTNISRPRQECRQLCPWRSSRCQFGQEEVLAFTWRSLLAAS